MTLNIMIMDNVFLYCYLNRGHIIIGVRNETNQQGIISIDPNHDYDKSYTVYKWYDEGVFPKEFDVCEQTVDGTFGKRLKVVGVDII